MPSAASERTRRYRERHPERHREMQRAYRERNREKLREMRRAYVAKYPDRIKAYDSAPTTRVRRMAGWRRRQYGISDVQFAEMFAAQGGLCAICKLEMNPPHVDHDHETGKVRSLLCGKCNKAIGLFNESAELLKAAQDYLAVHSEG